LWRGPRLAPGRVSIVTGTGNDSVFISDLRFDLGTVRIDTGNGGDTVHIEDTGFVLCHLIVDTGKGADGVAFAGLIYGVDSTITVDGGNGADILSGTASISSTLLFSTIDVETVA
jgi:hypothetical protein